MNIAVTGNIGSGKSAVSAMLAGLLQGDCVDADSICRELLTEGGEGLQELRKLWPEKYFDSKGVLDRARLREDVFRFSEVRAALEGILHPLVGDRLEQIMAVGGKERPHLVAEIPLLYEVGWENRFDCVVTVYAPTSLCAARTAERDGVPAGQVESILSLQLAPEEKADRADYVVDNSESWSQTAVQSFVVCREIHHFGAVGQRRNSMV